MPSLPKKSQTWNLSCQTNTTFLSPTDTSQKTEVDQSVQKAEELAMAQDSDWHALSPKEESDLESLMSN